MSDYQSLSSRFHKEFEFTQAGIMEPVEGHKIYGERSLKVIVERVGGSSVIDIEGQLQGQSSWDKIRTIRGRTSLLSIDISKFDRIRFNVIRFNPVNGIPSKLIASGFYSDPADLATLVALTKGNNAVVEELSCNVERILSTLMAINSQLNYITGLEIGEE